MLTFIETRIFSRLSDAYLDDDGLLALQVHLLQQPEASDLVRGSGGVRKMRWALPGRGKSGGPRVIYYLRLRQGQLLRRIKEEIDEES